MRNSIAKPVWVARRKESWDRSRMEELDAARHGRLPHDGINPARRELADTYRYTVDRITGFLNFFSTTVADRTSSGQRQSIQENSYSAHVYSRASDNLIGQSLFPRRSCRRSEVLIEFETRRGNYHRPGIPRPRRFLPPQQDSRRIHDHDESQRVGGQGAGKSTERSACTPRLPRSRRVHHQVPGSETGRYDHEGAAGVGRDEDYSGSSIFPTLIRLHSNAGLSRSIKRLRVYCNEGRSWTHWSVSSSF